MIDLEFIERLIRTLDDSGIDHVEIERGGTRVRISKTPATVATSAPADAVVSSSTPLPNPTQSSSPSEDVASAPAGEVDDLFEITSPMVGTFYRASSPDSEPFAEVGGSISSGDTLCIIEAMKLMNELESEVDGVIREICVSNGEPVEYGQILFRVEPV